MTTPLSRNEIETLCLKAARGAGFDWGLAEEAGFAAGWLHARGFDGASALLHVLQARLDPAIAMRGRDWHGEGGGGLCPIATGAALDDHARLPQGPLAAPLILHALHQPLLVVPFLARIAQAEDTAVSLRWPGGALALSGQCRPDLSALGDCAQTDLSVAPGDSGAGRPAPVVPSALAIAPVPDATREALGALALRTTVPPSDKSRADAGAGASDND